MHYTHTYSVWILLHARRFGASEADILRSYPSLRSEDLVNAWAYYRLQREEIEQQIYTNENFPLPAVEALRRLGHDVLTTLESGHAGQAMPDEQILSFAAKEGRILLTLNRKHFVRLHQIRPDHAGIIVYTFNMDFVGLAERIHMALAAQSNMAGQLVRINRPG